MEKSTNQEWIKLQTRLENEYDKSFKEGTFVNEFAPVKYTAALVESVYKSLSTVGDFPVVTWYREEEYDETRENGERAVILQTTEELIDFSTYEFDSEVDQLISSKFTNSGALYVNAVCRCPNEGQLVTSTRDCRDCVKWLSSWVPKYNGDKNKIYVEQDGQLVPMSYNSEAASLSVGTADEIKTLSDFPLDILSGGFVTITYNRLFQSGAINIGTLNSNFGGGGNIRSYYRGQKIVNVSENNGVPTGGQISFSQFRNVVSAVFAEGGGNFAHLQMRWEVFGDTLWQAPLPKAFRLSGHAGAVNIDNPALRFNNSGQGVIQMTTQGGGFAMGEPGQPGIANGGRGNDGGWGIHLATPVLIPEDVWRNRIKGAGGGGGAGGRGGNGGGGGHSGTIKCGGYFCWSRSRDCRNDGGNGGDGGRGGNGGWGRGYAWNGSSWVDTHAAGWGGAQGGQGGRGGDNRGGGGGGAGGNGGNGGSWGQPGAGGRDGRGGNDGNGEQHGCGWRGDRRGRGGNGGGGGGNNRDKFTTSHNGYRYT
jgi:hypothetical protein